MATTITNTLQGWRDYARIMGQPLDGEGGQNAFTAAKRASMTPGVTAIIRMTDGSGNRIYRDGQKVEAA
jgi:hypothetical protein